MARFGRLEDGTEITETTIAGGGLRVGVLTYGAVIRMLEVDGSGGPRNVVLGFSNLDDYVQRAPYFGAIAGRHANRLAGGRFPLDGRDVQLTLNEAGRTHLHGGLAGFPKRPWTLADAGPEHVTLTLVSEDGEEGYPGRVEATCRYAIDGDRTLAIELTATTDAPTIVNLAAHSYFDLDGDETILDHLMEIPAEAYTPVDGHLITTGEISPVAGTRFDFRRSRPIRGAGEHETYDHNFVLAMTRAEKPRLAARVVGPKSGRTLEVLSTEPGVQFYDGSYLRVAVPDGGGRMRGKNSGFCLEPQLFPDGPNKPAWPSAVLRPGETYRQRTVYRFGEV
jgi:aldose 1-epimerase